MSKAASDKSIQAMKELYKKGGFTVETADGVDNRNYTFSKMPFRKAKKLFAYLTEIAKDLQVGKLSFFDTPKFENEIEPLLMQYVLFDGFKLDTIPEHFEEFTSDYNQFVTVSIQAFSAPFMVETNTVSHSRVAETQPTTLRKPI